MTQVGVETCEFPSSSHLASATYDADAHELVINFADSRAWRYRSVPVSIYAGLTRAPSPGKYFHQHIRDGFPGEEE